jgi:hypothetical protein
VNFYKKLYCEQYQWQPKVDDLKCWEVDVVKVDIMVVQEFYSCSKFEKSRNGGNGSKMLFWPDVWCGELPLKVLFPELFTIAYGKDEWVEENMHINNGIIHWNILFTRPVQDWEVDRVARFFKLLYSQKVWYGGEDKICCIPSKGKSFEVKLYYHVLSALV